MKINKIQRRKIIEKQIIRLAKISLSKPVIPENIDWHNRVTDLQAKKMMERKFIK